MKTRKQSLSRTAISKTPNPGLTRICLAVSAAILSPMAMSPTVWANPDGASVVNGQVSLQNPSTGRLEITNSPGSIIDWKSFSIGVNELTRFNQVNNLSSVLNRVTGGNASEILGQLRSNGQVFLINPNGLVIGNGATIDTAGFIASTLDISNQDFLNGKLQFKGEGGAIVNRGFIHAGKNGEVVLIAPKIENHGVIEAEDGQIILAAGREVTLSSLNLDHISFRVQAPGDSAINLGKLLSRNGAVGLFADQVINKGTISANRVSRNATGQIVLHGTSSTRVSGSVEATGSGTSGGDIKILGDDISLTGAQIDASGSSGGGEILIGGEYQGRGQTPTAQKTTIDTGSQLHADATGNGDGGTIIAWSETTTTVDGLLTARGGPLGGDGGFIETSGRGQLNFSRPADVSAANGKGGTWLLDPENINIDSGKAGSIESALNKGSSVTVKTSDGGSGEGNITVSAGIEKSEGDDATLALIAHNRIDVNAPIRSTSNQLSVKLRAGSKIAVNASIDTNGGSLSSSLTGVAPPPPLLAETEPADAEPAAVDSDTATDSTSTRAWADTQDAYVPVEPAPAPEPMPEPVAAPVIEPLNADEVIVADVIIEPTLAVDSTA